MTPTPQAFDLFDASSDPQLGLERVRTWLREYNVQTNGLYMAMRELPEHAPKPLVLIAKSGASIVGGLVGESQFAWLKVSLMAVEPNRRGRGIGAALLDRAETEGRLRGCRYAYVDTMEYQAPDFYERRGYALAGRLPDWDSHGHAKYFFTKALVDAA